MNSTFVFDNRIVNPIKTNKRKASACRAESPKRGEGANTKQSDTLI